MPSKKAHIVRTHTTLINPASDIVDEILRVEGVRRVLPGIISQSGHSIGGRFRVKISTINGGLKLVVRGNKSIQEVWVYTTQDPQVSTKITDVIESMGIKVTHK